MKTTLIKLLLLTAGVLALNGCSSTIPLGGLITTEVAAKKASELLNQARAEASALIAQGGQQGNALIINAGNEMNVQTENAARILGGQTEKTVKNIGAEYQPVIASLLETMQKGQQLRGEAYQFKDAAVIDLTTLTATWPAIGNTFLVKSIRGTTMVYKADGTYRLTMQGVGLGIPSSRISTDTKLFFNGQEQKFKTEKLDDQTITFLIPANSLKFLDKDQAQISAKFEVSQQIRPWYGVGKSKSHYSIPVELSLIPRRAATIKIIRKFDEYDWKLLRHEIKDTPSGDHNCARCSDPPHAPYSAFIQVTNLKKGKPLPEDQQLRAQDLRCISGACPWSAVTSVNLEDNQSRLVGSWVVWGSPVSYRLSGDVYEFDATGKQAQEETLMDVYFDTPVEIKIPKAKGNSSILYFETYNKDKDYFVLGNNLSIFQLEKQVPSDDYDTYIYRVRRPD